MCDRTLPGGNRGCIHCYCLKCIGVERAPSGRWDCPHHFCDDCADVVTSVIYCRECPDSW
jgi:hypothetical protein